MVKCPVCFKNVKNNDLDDHSEKCFENGKHDENYFQRQIKGLILILEDNTSMIAREYIIEKLQMIQTIGIGFHPTIKRATFQYAMAFAEHTKRKDNDAVNRVLEAVRTYYREQNLTPLEMDKLRRYVEMKMVEEQI